jgi:hypothetical protein
MKLEIIADKISTILPGLIYCCVVIYIIRSRTSQRPHLYSVNRPAFEHV